MPRKPKIINVPGYKGPDRRKKERRKGWGIIREDGNYEFSSRDGPGVAWTMGEEQAFWQRPKTKAVNTNICIFKRNISAIQYFSLKYSLVWLILMKRFKNNEAHKYCW